MTSELNRPDDRDYDALFAEIFNNDLSDSLDLRKQIDAGIKRVFDEALALERALNASGSMEKEKVQEALKLLNDSWNALRIGGDAHSITGKVRATEYADEEEIVDLVGKGDLPFAGLGTRQEDARGYFYKADGFRCLPFGFDVEETRLGEHSADYRVTLQFGLDEDAPDQMVWFTAYPEDIEYIQPPQPSPDGAEIFIAEHFPDLAAAIERLPMDCQDDEEIRRALDDFVAHIDFSHIDSNMGSEDILDIIEAYITARISFDNTAYTVDIDGTVYGRTFRLEYVPSKYSGTLRECLVGQIHLFPVQGPGTKGDVTEYRPWLELWYLLPERGGGRTPIFVSIDAVKSLINTRPDVADYPFSDDTYVVQNEDAEGTFEPIFVKATQEGPIEAPKDNGESMEDEGASREELVREYAHDLQGLHAIIKDKYITKTYATLEAADAALHEANDLVVGFIQKWRIDRDFNTLIEVSGDGLIYPSGTSKSDLREEESSFSLEIDGLGLAEGDMFTSRRGLITSSYMDKIELEDEEGYGLRGVIMLSDTEEMPGTIITEANLGLPLVSVRVNKNFFINLGDDVLFEFPELTRIEKSKEVVELMTSLSERERASAVAQLGILEDALDNETETFMEYEQLDGLRNLALAMSGNDEEAEVVSQALEHVLGAGRRLHVQGPGYDEHGKLAAVELGTFILEAVTSKHTLLPSSEVTLVLREKKVDGTPGGRYLLPLSTIEKMEY